MNKPRRVGPEAESKIRRDVPSHSAVTPRTRALTLLLGLAGRAAVPVAAASVLVAHPARAQQWLTDRQYQEGPGAKVGNFELHPGIAAEGGYDSNWFLRTDKAGFVNSGVVGSPELRVTPSLSLATLGAQRIEGKTDVDPPSVGFRAGISGTYREFFGQLNPEQRNMSVDANARLDILPQRPFGGAIYATYNRLIQPSVFGEPDLSFNADRITAGAEVATQPGGVSGTLDWHFGGTYATTLYEQGGGQGYNNYAVSAYTRGRWKFRPRTALLYDGSVSFVSFDDTTAGSGVIAALHSSDPVRARVGINGLITPRLSLLAMAGYGGSFFSPGSSPVVKQYDSVIAQAELKFFLTAPPDSPEGQSLSQSTLAVGYTRDFQTSYISDFYGLDRGYMKLSYFFAGRALMSLEGGAAALEYPELFLFSSAANKGTPGFTDTRIDATLYGEYRFINWLALTGTVKYTTNLSGESFNITPIGTAGPAQLYAMQWQRFEAYLGLRLFL